MTSSHDGVAAVEVDSAAASSASEFCPIVW
jgi:hypothetical protein